jgi:uncharacterized protein (UPF0333 family)
MMQERANISKEQLMGIAITLLFAIVTSWVTMTQRVKALEVGTDIRLKQLEQQVSINESYYREILKEIQDICVALENKENRK